MDEAEATKNPSLMFEIVIIREVKLLESHGCFCRVRLADFVYVLKLLICNLRQSC